jgi:hypothetical protein
MGGVLDSPSCLHPAARKYGPHPRLIHLRP